MKYIFYICAAIALLKLYYEIRYQVELWLLKRRIRRVMAMCDEIMAHYNRRN